MTKVAIWCRHISDNIIGIGADIPWKIPSDSKRFRNLTLNKTLVVGKKTYESFPNRTLPNRKFLVVTHQADYEVSDPINHKVITDIKSLKDYPEDLYISGGAAVYEAFFASDALAPEIVVDCVYNGEMLQGLEGTPATVTPCVEVLEKKYKAFPKKFDLDNVTTTVWLKKKSFIDQAVIKAIITYLETEG